ncbi:MAG TPA: di-heme oxidoredictase family protein, partial [Polyangiaceae bacterium]|nr:di-heme oxidoredictase family protein [Polyangiaceae bacterium]
VACIMTGCAEHAESDPAQRDESQRLPGGETTNTLLFGTNALTMPAANITAEHESQFFTGNSFFNQSWVQAPASTEARDGLGPLFNARSCASCHFKDGRGSPPLEEGAPFVGLLLRLSVPSASGSGQPLPDPVYGGQLQPLAIGGVESEGAPRVSYTEVRGSYADGEAYVLLEPSYTIGDLTHGALADGVQISPRVAPAVVGLGLLEAIPSARLLELADPEDVDGDGISGRIQHTLDAATGLMREGRFGWKAEQPSVRQQAAAAFVGDLGVTSSLFPEQDCTPAESACRAATPGGSPELADHLLDRVELYSRLLAVPMRERWRDASLLEGQRLFSSARCDACHVASHETGALEGLPEVENQRIYPYTDLLLHDMGEALADARPVFEASGSEWRTPPLWALRFYRIVNGHDRLLHDGRARGVAEAILWHGGEATPSREAFRTMTREQRSQLIEFVESL